MKKRRFYLLFLLIPIVMATTWVGSGTTNYWWKALYKFTNTPFVCNSLGTITDTLDSRAHVRSLLSSVNVLPTTVRSYLSSSATGLSYSNSTGVFGLASGYYIPRVADTVNFNTALHQQTRGAWLPNLTTVQRNAIGSPGIGVIILNITTGDLNYWDGTAWRALMIR